MARVTAIFLSCVLLTASSLLASNVEDTYQAALAQEKGEGNLEEAIRIYQQVIEAHEKGEGDEKLAARAQLRIGVCQEKLGLAQARQTYEAVRDKYPDQPQVGAEAARRLGSTHQREAVIEQPSHRTTSESYIRRQMQQVMERAKQQKELTERQLEAIQRQITKQTERQTEQVKQLTEPTKRRVEQTERSTSADSAFIGEQVRRQLEAAQRQMEQQLKQAKRQMEALQRQLERQQKQLERQLETIQRQGFRFEQIRPRRSERLIPPNFLRGSDQRYYHYAYTPPVVPYAYEEVAEVPVQWKFRLTELRYPQQQPTAYTASDFDDSDWATIDIGQAWEDQGYEGHDEGAWYRARIKVDAEEGRPVLMAFGGIDKDAYVYVNGQWVGQHKVWNWPFILDISDQVVRDGENVVALYVYDGKNMGGVYGLINVHQPTDEAKTDNFAVNRGGRLEMVDERNGWPVFKDHFASGKRYSRYAHRPPRIPYAYNKVAEVPVQWKFYPYPEEYQGDQDPILSAADFDDTDWADIDIGQAWEDQGYEGYDEGAWYRAQIEVNAEKGRPVHLAFGGVDNNAYVYVNGIFVGEHYGWNTPFILDISEAVNYKGQNAVAVRVYDGMNMGGIYGTIEVIQPTVKENLDRYLANRGISAQQKQTDLDEEEKRSFWSRFF
ncbi:MAG: tetratricopeptide repeat protein [Gemmatimonadetes bacterium]|nr:tetratricopeptide repeat protein [Gemmatimonadota bacterium]MYB67184.1 tetratricopeptide repeat protein [Gemmatimonadota bacterium]